jgi:hypothetical protein
MKLEYALTLDDFRELTASMNPLPRGQKAWVQMVIWLVLFFLLLANVYLYGLVASAQQRSGGARAALDVPEQNLWVLLAPHLLIATFLLIAVLISPLRSNSLQARSKSQARMLRVTGLLSLLCGVWMIPVLVPGLAIYWRPTQGQLLWASFTPWALYFAAVRPILSVRRKRLIDKTWASLPSLHRTTRADVSRAEIQLEDGLVEHQYRWAFFKRYSETQNLLLLINIDDVPAVVVPKRALPDDRAMDELKMLLSENVPDGQFLQKQQAFPVIVTGPSIGGK